MARTILDDYLQAFPFWLMDVSSINELPVLNPLLGFSSITAPEITAEIQDITEGNWIFKKKVLKNADVGNITLMRGATFYDLDFYNWILAALGVKQALSVGATFGGFSPRRNLLLIHYFSSRPNEFGDSLVPSSPGPFEVLARVPARAFYLQGCIPVRYKSGTDYDARSSDISVLELELAVESMEQVVLTK